MRKFFIEEKSGDKFNESWKDGNIHYVVNRYLRTVTAIIYPTYDLLMDIRRCIRQANLPIFHFEYEKLFLPKMTATAYCSPGDEFDEEKGKRIAKAKLLRHVYKEKFKLMKELAKRVLVFAHRLEDKTCHYNHTWIKYDVLLDNAEELLS